jgi:hypothetical protein
MLLSVVVVFVTEGQEGGTAPVRLPRQNQERPKNVPFFFDAFLVLFSLRS